MSRPSRFVRYLPLLLPLLPILVFGMGRLAGWGETNPGANGRDATTLPPLVGAELSRERGAIDRLNDREAYEKAQQVVRAELLPPRVAPQFPDADSSAEVSPISIVRRKPHLYRVRGMVVWREAGGAMRRQRFEADVRHGPVGNKWSLVDTEFLANAPETP